jgi:peroxiredoxin
MKAIHVMMLALLMATASWAQGLKVGDAAVDFNLKNVDGKMVALKDFQSSKGVIVVFTCNTCPYSQAYEQRIIDLHKTFVSKGYPVVAINPNDPVKQPGDSFDKMVERAKDKAYPFAYLFDETQAIATAYGATRTPHVFVLQKTPSGFQVAYIGAIDDNVETPSAAKNRYVEAAIESLSQGKTPSVTSTKAIGCTIKWKKAS